MNQDQIVVESPEAETFPITDVNHFAQLVVAWHKRHVMRVAHYLNIPDGIEVKIDEDQPIVLTGDAYKAFLIAINLALNELGTLPFVAEMEPEEDPPVKVEEPGTDYVKG